MTLDPAPVGVAAVFACLADQSRRQVIGVLASRGEASTTAIADQLAITRQAVAKHLTTLDEVGLVSARRVGREVRYRLRPGPLRLAARWLEGTAGAWDDRLTAVKAALEQGTR